MKDILFNPETREIVLKGGDFETTDNPSVQNGAIIKDSRCPNVYFPTLGIGLIPVNKPINKVVFDLNRWSIQCRQDGAKNATSTLTQKGNDAEIKISVSYV